MDLGLQNRTVFISGSSQGIGLDIAKSFLAEGANVAISARGRENLEAAATARAAQLATHKNTTRATTA